jgi:hypothetical protein
MGDAKRLPGALNGPEVYDLICKTAAVAPAWRHLRTTHWVMNLEWYRAVRRAFLRPDADDDDRDESKWEPQPGDTVFGYRIIVTGDGGVPHLVDGRPGNG